MCRCGKSVLGAVRFCLKLGPAWRALEEGTHTDDPRQVYQRLSLARGCPLLSLQGAAGCRQSSLCFAEAARSPGNAQQRRHSVKLSRGCPLLSLAEAAFC